jgi:hypothetical protein
MEPEGVPDIKTEWPSDHRTDYLLIHYSYCVCYSTNHGRTDLFPKPQTPDFYGTIMGKHPKSDG